MKDATETPHRWHGELKFPRGLWELLTESAAKNGRRINQEILFNLRLSLGPERPQSTSRKGK